MLEKIIVDSFPGFLSIRNSKYEIIYLNENFRKWIGLYTSINPIGKTNEELAKIVPKNIANVFIQCHDLSLCWEKNNTSNNSLNKTIEFRDEKSGKNMYMNVLKYSILNNGESQIVTIGYDITELYNENRKNFEFSITDSLTNAYNKKFLIDNFKKYTNQFSILIDIDNFKKLNDTEGHYAGDKFLEIFINILKNNLTNYDAIIRYGGDEFIIVFSKKITLNYIYLQINKIREIFKKEFLNYSYLSFSYGVSLIKESLEETLIELDKKMYKEKKSKNKNI